ncbi:MAG: ABC transporter permease [bacterium]
MRKWIKIAFRNILKNRRRSLVTLIAIAMGFASVSLFQGYVDDVYEGFRISVIREDGLGHLTIYKEGWLENGKRDPDKYMFSKEETLKIVDLLQGDSDVVLVTPQMHVSGLVSNGKISTIFLAKGLIAKDDELIRGDNEIALPRDGELLNDKKYNGIEMAKDLAKYLDLKPGDDAVVMASTLDGQMNAMDIHVSGVYDTGIATTNDKFMRFLLPFAQSLYDTDKVDQIVVLLKDWTLTEQARIRLLSTLSENGLQCEMKTWKEIADYYRQVKGMFDMIFTFIFIIVLIIVNMSVINTMGTAVLERTREIGTLRAMGMKRSGVSILFAIEGAMLGCLGSVMGMIIHIVVWVIIRITNPTYMPPGISTPVPLIINLIPFFMFLLLIFLIVLSLLAAILPARRASKLNVVDALGYV